ncbi:MAG: helix-turn-helix domain-containing protein [Trebonia sp.]
MPAVEVQACPACRTGMLARRGDPLCPTCMKAAREMPSQPSWLFDSPLLRQALAEVNLPAVPGIVRAACGVSQKDLAAMVGWSEAVLSYYARGIRDGMYDVRTVLQFADAVGMPRAALLPLVFADVDVSLASGPRTGTGAEQNRPGGYAAEPGLPAALPAVSAPRRASSAHIRYWQACADVLYARDRSVGGTALLPLAMQQWRRARLAARENGGAETGSQLLAAAGELALCTGWIALDAGQLSLAQPLYEEARELAAGSGDVVLGVHVLTNQSMLHLELARTGPVREPARRALRLAFQAQDEGRYLPVPRLHALIALRHASAAALLGDKAAFQKAVAQARRELDRGPEDEDPPEWLRFVDHAEITGMEAHGWLYLGDPGRSTVLYRQVLTSRLSPRNRASYGAGLADALLKQGARQDAITAAMDVLLALEGGVTSTRCLNQLRLVRCAAANTPGAEEFCARFDAAERTQAASPACLYAGIAYKADVPALCPHKEHGQLACPGKPRTRSAAWFTVRPSRRGRSAGTCTSTSRLCRCPARCRRLASCRRSACCSAGTRTFRPWTRRAAAG